jgi:hypothetical protein
VIDKSAAEAAIDLVGVGPRESEPDEQIFERTCLNWINQWLSKASEKEWKQGCCLFLFDPQRRPESLLVGCQRQLGFRLSFPTNLEGHAYSCATGMSAVFREKISIASFEIPEMLEWVSAKDLEQCLVIVFSPRLRQVYTKRIGVKVEADEDLLCIQLSKPSERIPFELQNLDKILEFFYDYGVKTHLANCRIWKDSKARELVEKPEDMVQKSLYQTLLTHINYEGRGVAQIEVYDVHGREDIQIIVHQNGDYVVGIVELKVLFPNKSENWNLNWALKGIAQVCGYREATKLQKVECVYTCLYDGRKQDVPIPKFFKEAAKQNVSGRRYFMSTDNVSRKIQSFIQ